MKNIETTPTSCGRLSGASAALTSSLLACALGACLLAGCGETTSEVVRPSELHRLSSSGGSDGFAIAYDGRGRGAYVTVGDTRLRLCAEPSPDVSANLQASSSVQAALEAAVTYEALNVGAEGSGSRREEARSEVANVANRTELVLILRSAMYRICESHINGVVNGEQAREMFGDVLRTVANLGRRDNVARLIDVLRDGEELDPAQRNRVLDAVVALSLLEAAGYTDSEATERILSASGANGLLRSLSQPSPSGPSSTP